MNPGDLPEGYRPHIQDAYDDSGDQFAEGRPQTPEQVSHLVKVATELRDAWLRDPTSRRSAMCEFKLVAAVDALAGRPGVSELEEWLDRLRVTPARSDLVRDGDCLIRRDDFYRLLSFARESVVVIRKCLSALDEHFEMGEKSGAAAADFARAFLKEGK